MKYIEKNRNISGLKHLILAVIILTCCCTGSFAGLRDNGDDETFNGRFYRGRGDADYLRLLDIAARMFAPDPEFQNLAMLYAPKYNGLTEGPTWGGGWWIKNSYGATYCALPMLREPYLTFLQTSQDFWFDQMGDGKTTRSYGHIAPDGCLCDCAGPDGFFVAKQGDGDPDGTVYDWAFEFTAAGIVMQSELLLISRDRKAIEHYLPKLRRASDFIETRRDPKTMLFLVGVASNLHGPNYSGCKKPDGTLDKAYLTGMSITYIAALDRLIELEKLAGNAENVKLSAKRRELTRKGLPLLTTDEGYFIKSLDPDGTKHGVYGAAKHGYFESAPNHDAICFRVADDIQSEKIYNKIASIPQLRPFDLILVNHPAYDDLWSPLGFLTFGFNVNGGHWSTDEARMLMSYYRLGKFEDARRSMKQILKFAHQFRMDNGLTEFGAAVYQPNEPINCVYDTWGAPAGMIRGLFEYLYRAEGLTILPHIPSGITQLEQHFPIRFGQKRLYLATTGQGNVTGVIVNGKPWSRFDSKSISLPYNETPDEAVIQVLLGGAKATTFVPDRPEDEPLPVLSADDQPLPLTKPPLVLMANPYPLRIGADAGLATPFHGGMGGIRLYNTALNARDVAALGDAWPSGGVGGSALLGCWNLGDMAEGIVPNTAWPDMPLHLSGQVRETAGPQGKAVELDGKGYFFDAGSELRFCLQGEVTMDAWIRPGPKGGRILGKTHYASPTYGYVLDYTADGELRCSVASGTLRYPARLPADRWSRVTATVTYDGTITLYVDGKQVARQPWLPLPAEDYAAINNRVNIIRDFYNRLLKAGLGNSYEAEHARLAVGYWATTCQRLKMVATGKLTPLTPVAQTFADRLYCQTTINLCEGLEKRIQSYSNSENLQLLQIQQVWNQR